MLNKREKEKHCKYEKQFTDRYKEVLCINVCKEYPAKDCCIGCLNYLTCTMRCRLADKVFDKIDR